MAENEPPVPPEEVPAPVKTPPTRSAPRDHVERIRLPSGKIVNRVVRNS